MHYLFHVWARPLLNELHMKFIEPQLDSFISAIHKTVDSERILPGIWGFVDGTCLPICRPSENQNAFYSGYKRHHILKYLCITTPDGLIQAAIGPFLGKDHDATLMHDAKINATLLRHFGSPSNYDVPPKLYGDVAFAQTPYVARSFRPNGRDPLNAQKTEVNLAFAKVRISIEWAFGKVKTNWAYINDRKNMKIFLSTASAQAFQVAVFLSNCLHCFNPETNSTTSKFNLRPLMIDEYLRRRKFL